ncbi:hypothetical protein GJA_5572 [Janthinobacterium agaricidamnosum NBRC 102515 = DSM 9628]|uniref:Uncharacterized protein n=1 Tax=Janthinobacterium agaricidamnosum NBRC 102515 = DSM 9628 TaxID=1349767 RepID=W0VBH0_9BURK|nr:hypothetical protein GJA_5572 [Janthinobacterium agaricidamnosum NBRC 102515 = DSM 9628]
MVGERQRHQGCALARRLERGHQPCAYPAAISRHIGAGAHLARPVRPTAESLDAARTLGAAYFELGTATGAVLARIPAPTADDG